MAGFSLRRKAAGVRGRERDTYLDGSTTLSGSERGASLRQGTQEQGQEPDFDRLDESLYGMGESMVVEGATDAKAFEVYVEHFLAPSLCVRGRLW